MRQRLRGGLQSARHVNLQALRQVPKTAVAMVPLNTLKK